MPDTPTQSLTVNGQCLCGTCRYHIEGESLGMIYCTCQRCRKHSGAALVGFVIFASGHMTWRGGKDNIGSYLHDLWPRSFCRTCGSTVTAPGESESDIRGVLAGNVIDMDPPIDEWHLFAGSCSPWYRVPEGVKQYETVATEYGEDPGLAELDRHLEQDRITGSCLCGEVSFSASDPKRMMNCHCSRCRLSRSAPHATNLFVAAEDFEWRSGAELVQRYDLPGAERFGADFCGRCGSLAPRVMQDFVNIPAGCLDSDPHMQPAGHIFTGSMARWFQIRDDLPQWQERPG